MHLPSRTHVVRRMRSGASILALAMASSGAIPQQALAAQVQAVVIFELSESLNMSAAAQNLRSTSLGNCLQLIIERGRFNGIRSYYTCAEHAGAQ
jgi:hypothetical protein